MVYRTWVHLVDEVTFQVVNLFQRRHRQDASTPEALRAYLDHWNGPARPTFFEPPRSLAMAPLFEAVTGEGPVRLSFPSPVPTEFAENQRCVFDFFPVSARWRERPVMFLLHGLMSASDRGYRSWARKINGQGWNAAFVHLPFHYERRPRGYLSGELAVGPHGIRTVEGVRQAVVEVRALIHGLAGMGAPRFGVWGMSYGGWVAALIAASEPRLDCAFLLEPIVNFEFAVWSSPATQTLRRAIEANGVTRELSREVDRLISPLDLAPVCDRSRIVVVAAEFDRIITPEVIRAFAERWRCPRFRCYPQGHVGYRLMREAFREWREDFAADPVSVPVDGVRTALR